MSAALTAAIAMLWALLEGAMASLVAVPWIVPSLLLSKVWPPSVTPLVER
jgi:hypothetical protein